MSERPEHHGRPRSSRQRYHDFVHDYKKRRLDDPADAPKGDGPAENAAGADEGTPGPASQGLDRAQRRAYLREYIH